MKQSNKQYTPWERSDSEEVEIQDPISQATPQQFGSFISALRKIADGRKQAAADASRS